MRVAAGKAADLAGSAAVPALRPLADPEVRTVALVRLRTGLGDLLASVPALRALRRARPDLHVALVTYEQMRGVVERLGDYVDEFVAFPGDPGIPERPPAEPEIRRRFWAAMQERRFDLAVQMYGALPAANRVTESFRAGLTAGFVTPGAFPADLRSHLPYPFRAHEIDRHLRLFDFLGAPSAGRQLEFPMSADDRRATGSLLTESGLPDDFAVVHPGATAASRQWPASAFAAVADGLVARGLAVAVTGVPSERDLVDAVRTGMRAPSVDLCGRTDLGSAAGVVAAARVVVSNDTGIVQIAVALGTPTVTVYLAGDASRWRGSDVGKHRAALADVGCNPCGLLVCPIDFRCATWLTPDAVLRQVDRLELSPPRRPWPDTGDPPAVLERGGR